MALVGQPIAIGTASTTLMTVPATLEASLHSLLIANPTGGNLNVTLSYFDSGTSSELSLLTQTVTGDTTLKAFDAPINMAAGDKVNASASGSGLIALVSRFENSSTPAAVGFTPRGNYDASTTYQTNDIVFLVSDSNSYLSRTDSNLNNVPSSNPSNWQVFGAVGSAGSGFDGSGNASASGQLNIGTVNSTALISDADGNLRDIPLSTKVSGNYTLAIGDVGNQVTINSANVIITVPTGVFGVGDIVSLVSVNGCTATLACTAVNAVKAGDLAATALHTLDANGVASIMFSYTADLAVLTGNIS